MLVSRCDPDLARPTCTGTLFANGVFSELVHFRGSIEGLSDEELENFIACCPITQ
jgi:hypothetical protein